MRSIAIPVADREECAIALDVAFKLGKSLRADVAGYHMRPNKLVAAESRLDLTELWGGSNSHWPQEDEAIIESAAESARKLFEQMALQHGYGVFKKHGSIDNPHALWHEKLGTPDKLMPLIGPINDMLVVSRPNKNGGRKAWLILMSALLDSGVPVLILPQKRMDSVGKHVAIAWNRGVQEAQAVHSVIPVLQQAEKVTFLSVGKEPKHGPTAKDMITFLRAYGIKAEEQRTIGEAGPMLVKAAQSVGADLLVSGAYTKGRLRQMLFGGVTEHLIWNTNFPVLLRHG
jgi:nucleotide-binding universal stress UspA family protein